MVSKYTTVSCVGIIGVSVIAVTNGCRPRNYGNESGADTLAAFVPSAARGRATVSYKSPGGVTEQCVATKNFPGITYDEDDVKDENELCGLDFYKVPSAPNDTSSVALCPKMSSTFPGIEVYELGNNNKTTYENSLCRDQDNRPTSRLGKFKQSVSCSYTGSILSYYHISRVLGGALNVPVAVIRTMDTSQHAIVAKRGAAWSSSLNQQLWNQVLGYDTKGGKRDNYFSADGKTVFGALSVNPKGEERYGEINQNYADPTAARLNFLEKPIVKRVFEAGGIGAIAQRTLAGAAPIIQQMRDISDLIAIDHIMQQQDRFGNIHYQEYYYYLKDNGKIAKKRAKREANGDLSPKPAPDAVIVKRMLAKDNDCGSRSGNAKAFTLDEVKRLKHMSPRTYKGIRFLAQNWRTGVAKSFFQSEALLNTPDVFDNEGIEGFGARLMKVSDALYANCKSGSLLLDLDIEDHIKGTNLPEQVRAKCDEVLSADSSSANSPSASAPSANSPSPTTPDPVQFVARSCKVQSGDNVTNVRKTPNGELYMSLSNGAAVRVVAESGDWYSVEYRLNQMDHGLRFSRPAWIYKPLLKCD